MCKHLAQMYENLQDGIAIAGYSTQCFCAPTESSAVPGLETRLRARTIEVFAVYVQRYCDAHRSCDAAGVGTVSLKRAIARLQRL